MTHTNESNQKEIPVPFKMSGWVAVIAALIVLGIGSMKIYDIYQNYTAAHILGDNVEFPWVKTGVYTIIYLIITFGFITSGNQQLTPNTALVFTFMGKYVGTLRGPGFFWVPFWWSICGDERDLSIKTIRIKKLEVNDQNGNPVFIACDIFCTEKDTYKATFDISDLDDYLESRGQVALRKLAMTYPMDAKEDTGKSLRNNITDIRSELQTDITTEYEKAGYEVESAAITKLVYAPEIAGMMLQKQQANATLDARKIIVEGATHIVRETIKEMEKEGEGKLTIPAEEKSRLMSNLLVVLCSHQTVSPVITL